MHILHFLPPLEIFKRYVEMQEQQRKKTRYGLC
jgi:hypothetical protein